jgi:hypothetical protein
MPEKKKHPRLMVLNEPDGRRFSKALAMEIGRDHAEVFLQIEYLISISTTPEIEGRLWTRESIRDLQRNHFPYWGQTFIRKVLSDLVNGYDHVQRSVIGQGKSQKREGITVHIEPLIDVAYHDLVSMTSWYALNEAGILKLRSVRLDIDAVASVRTSRAPVSAARAPVRDHAHTLHTEIPTETPTERGGPPSPLVSVFPTSKPSESTGVQRLQDILHGKR